MDDVADRAVLGLHGNLLAARMRSFSAEDRETFAEQRKLELAEFRDNGVNAPDIDADSDYNYENFIHTFPASDVESSEIEEELADEDDEELLQGDISPSASSTNMQPSGTQITRTSKFALDVGDSTQKEILENMPVERNELRNMEDISYPLEAAHIGFYLNAFSRLNLMDHAFVHPSIWESFAVEKLPEKFPDPTNFIFGNMLYKNLVIPVFHLNQDHTNEFSHWSLLCVNTENGKCVHYDSTGDNFFYDSLTFYVVNEYILSNVNLQRELRLETADYTRLPLQKDAVSCGVYVCFYAKYALQDDEDLMYTAKFDAVQFRREIVNVIGKGKRNFLSGNMAILFKIYSSCKNLAEILRGHHSPRNHQASSTYSARRENDMGVQHKSPLTTGTFPFFIHAHT